MNEPWPESPALRARLDAFPPGAAALATLRADWLAGRLGEAHNRVAGVVEPPRPGDVLRWPPSDDAHAEARAQGLEALRRGEVGLLLLNGGMATRFGGVVKGIVPVDGDRSFLALKLLDALRVAEAAGAAPPVVILMNSRATNEATREHLAANEAFGYPRDRIWMFEQQWTSRLTPEGEIFLDDEGEPSFYGPGHGDLAPCLKASGLLSRFEATGGRTLLMSNVDNVVATLDAGIVGQHLAGGRAITVELVPKFPGDAGGAPAYVDGRLQIVEAFRFPVGFDQDRIPVFNTNTLWFQVEALRRDHPLTWFVVRKEVDGRPAIQFERLVGELTAFESTQWLEVSRIGNASRFIPIKNPADLEAGRDALMAAWRSRQAL